MIQEFRVGIDAIVLQAGRFKGDLHRGLLRPEPFRLGSRVQEKGDRLIYDRTSQLLFFDRDGSESGRAIPIGIIQSKRIFNARDIPME